jgi:hypothetical protein
VLVYNTSSIPITVGTVTVPAGTTPQTAVDVPWQYFRDDPQAFQDLVAGALVPVGPPDLDWNDLRIKCFQGTWLATTTLSASTTYLVPTYLFTGAFSTGRLYFVTTSGSATFSLQASADGGQTWSSLPDWSPLSLNVGNVAVLLPPAAILLSGSLTTGSGGWSGTIQFTLQ